MQKISYTDCKHPKANHQAWVSFSSVRFLFTFKPTAGRDQYGTTLLCANTKISFFKASRSMRGCLAGVLFRGFVELGLGLGVCKGAAASAGAGLVEADKEEEVEGSSPPSTWSSPSLKCFAFLLEGAFALAPGEALLLGPALPLGVDLALAFAFAEALAFALGLTCAAVVLDSTPSSVSASRFAGWLLLLPLPLPFFSCSLSPCFTRFRPLPFRAGESCLRARFWSSRVKNAATGDGGTSSLSARSGGDGCVKGISTPFSEAKGESTTVIATAGEPGQPGSWQIGCWVIPSPTFEGNFRTNLQTRSPLNTMTPTSAADAADGGLEACCFRSSSCCLR